MHRHLELKYELHYFASRWFKYWDNGEVHYCQTDGLLFLPQHRRLVVVEAKIKHCPEAYYQIEGLYRPILSWLFPSWKVVSCEVVKWFDAAVDFPVEPALRKEVHFAEPGEFAVHILNRPAV